MERLETKTQRYIVSTVHAGALQGDRPYETAIGCPIRKKWKIVQEYDTEQEAKQFHETWTMLAEILDFDKLEDKSTWMRDNG